jgi:hypothetical protein
VCSSEGLLDRTYSLTERNASRISLLEEQIQTLARAVCILTGAGQMAESVLDLVVESRAEAETAPQD